MTIFEFTDENSKNDSLCLLYRSIPYNLLTMEPFVMQYSLSVLHDGQMPTRIYGRKSDKAQI